MHIIEKILLIDNIFNMLIISLGGCESKFPTSSMSSIQPTNHGKHQFPLNSQHPPCTEATVGSQPITTCFSYVVKYDQTLATTTEGPIKPREGGGKIITINMPPTWETVTLIISLNGTFDVIYSFWCLFLF